LAFLDLFLSGIAFPLVRAGLDACLHLTLTVDGCDTSGNEPCLRRSEADSDTWRSGVVQVSGGRAPSTTSAAREHGIIDTLNQADLPCWADKGYQGAGGTVDLGGETMPISPD
jgi:hypothetical protein